MPPSVVLAQPQVLVMPLPSAMTAEVSARQHLTSLSAAVTFLRSIANISHIVLLLYIHTVNYNQCKNTLFHPNKIITTN